MFRCLLIEHNLLQNKYSITIRCHISRLGTSILTKYAFTMSAITQTILLLTCSNIFMTFAWYAHLKNLSTSPWIIAVFVSWAIALFEYLLQVPGNRIGFTLLSLPQLKILQEVITLVVFLPFCVLYMRQPIRLDFLWAGLCLLGAVYFAFRGGAGA